MPRKPLTALLLVEDNPGDTRLLREMLNEQAGHGAELITVGTLADAERMLTRRSVDVVLLDLGLPDAQGLEAVRRAHVAAPRAPLVVLTGLDDEQIAGQALKEGAQDYLIKGEIDGRGLLRAVRYAIERKHMEEALFEEKERAQVTLNCIGDAVVSTDSRGNVTFVNLVAEHMTGWTQKDAAGRPLAEVIRILNADTGESVVDRWRLPSVRADRRICGRTATSCDATEAKCRSRTAPQPSTTAMERRQGR